MVGCEKKNNTPPKSFTVTNVKFDSWDFSEPYSDILDYDFLDISIFTSEGRMYEDYFYHLYKNRLESEYRIYPTNALSDNSFNTSIKANYFSDDNIYYYLFIRGCDSYDYEYYNDFPQDLDELFEGFISVLVFTKNDIENKTSITLKGQYSNQFTLKLKWNY